MKFGKYLLENQTEEWKQMYIDYDKLKKLIKILAGLQLTSPQDGSKGTSLSVAMPTNAAGIPMTGDLSVTQENFYAVLEEEMKKIDNFVKEKVAEIRKQLKSYEKEVLDQRDVITEDFVNTLRPKVDTSAEEFLKLEKFVNLNFTGFHKILKKHDKVLPNPCKAFYIARLHTHSWVRGNYSDIIVTMSSIYSSLRGDESLEADENEKQDFVRSTTKFWVHTEDISTVKFIVLQHLPVFLQDTMQGGESDAQLVNSVYIDNRSMELYHGRLDKTPGAIALRMRWYGTSTPEVVFVERKTHRESWCGEVSVKERFVVSEKQVPDILRGKFDIDKEVQKMTNKGKSKEAIQEWLTLVNEVTQAINYKQLEPTMRTQYMRTAFQIPFDATVRVSLDTNLCMINERSEDVAAGQRWYRDPTVPVPKNEITRFPHAVLEIKLQLEDANSTPAWVTELVQSNMLQQVHKFSKFIHGCATLMPDEVQAFPYWIDDSTLVASMANAPAKEYLTGKTVGANQFFNHLLPHGEDGQLRVTKKEISRPVQQFNKETELTSLSAASKSVANNKAATSYSAIANDEEYGNPNEEDDEAEYDRCSAHWWKGCCPSIFCDTFMEMEDLHMTPQKTEPKLFFANERTFMKWLHMAVILSSASVGVLAFTPSDSTAQLFALMLLPIALLFAIYPLWTYLWRLGKIRNRDTSRWDDPMGPILITSMLILALCIQFVYKKTIWDMGSKVLFDRINSSFLRQGAMKLIGAELRKVEYGLCEILLPYSQNVTQQQNGFHGGLIGTIADNAGGYAGLSVLSYDMEVLTVEYKINFVANFTNGSLLAIGKVIKPGRRIILATVNVYHLDSSGNQSLCAVMQQTLIPVKVENKF